MGKEGIRETIRGGKRRRAAPRCVILIVKVYLAARHTPARFNRAELSPMRIAILSLLGVLVLTGCNRESGTADGKVTLRVGHFPNITHAQALIAKEMKQEGKDWYGERLGPDVTLQWFVYNAGPSAMEAIFAGSIDLTYVGPNPVLTAYDRSKGEEIRVVCGASAGGAALIVPADGRLSKPEDFRGKRLATPQLGNTQDVAARAWLHQNGFKVTQMGGDVQVLPTANPDQLSLFQQGKIDAVWTVEPWVSRLEMEANGKIMIEEKEALAAVLACSVEALETRRDLVAKFVAGHKELTEWINQNPAEAKRLVAAALTRETRRTFPPALADHAWPRLKFSTEISQKSFDELVKEAQSVGFLQGATALDRLVTPIQ
jgi:NitT/TauT family transport system substrate-binding protein